MTEVMIHMKPEALPQIEATDLYWKYSKQFGKDEIDVRVVDHLDLEDEELCDSFGIDYDLVNCIELV